jgi:hypothetical protein
MKNKNPIVVIFITVGILLCISLGIWFFVHPGLKTNKMGSCPAVPSWFSKADLVGTWVAQDYAPTTAIDTLIIRADGKYKQIIHLNKETPLDYESDWQPWRLEYGKKGLPFIYLQNYRICAANEYYDCYKEYNLSSPDCCNDLPHESQPGELALTVVGMPDFVTPSRTPAGDLMLILFQGCELSAWEYRLQQP